jgi:CoA:oxalate CoA-transferase
MTPPPLDGIRVFDLTIAGAGPRAGRMLAELGAEVIKVEPPGDGDVMLGRPPTQHGQSVGYTHFNRGKRSMFLELREPGDRALAHELIGRCDVFLNNMRPGVAERLGVGYAELSAINPRLIYGYLSAWGREGPLASWPGADPVVQFYSGWCSIQGEDGGQPEFGRYVGHIDDSGAAALVGGVLQALLDRNRTGRGQMVEVSLLNASLAIQITRVSEHLAGSTPTPMGSACSTTAPHEAFLCGDGNYVAIGVLNDRQWRALCQTLELAPLADDPRFATNADRVGNRLELKRILDAVCAKWPSNWIQIRLKRANVPHGRFYDWENIRDHVQVRDNEFIRLVDVPIAGQMYLVNPPWELSLSRRPELTVPRPGGDTDALLSWLHKPAPGPALGRAPAAADREGRSKALAGIVVVDVTQGICGPYTSQLLADAGATVLKIEPPDGDYARRMGPPFIGSDSATFLALNRNKRSVTLDLERADDVRSLQRLAATADVFLEDWVLNGTPPAIAREELVRSNPRLVHASITAFGEHGPLAGRPASELVIQAMTEYCGGLGRVGGPPVRMGPDVANISTAVYAFDAILAALLQRERDDVGQSVSISQFGTLLYARGTVWASQGDPDEWDGWAARPFMPPDYGYLAKDGRFYFIMLRGDQETFDGLMIELGLLDHLADPRFGKGGRDAVGIGRYAAEVKPIWEATFLSRTIEELTELVQRHGGLIAPLNDYDSLFADPKVQPLHLLRDVTLADGSSYRTLSPTTRFSALSNSTEGRPPTLGEHTRDVIVAGVVAAAGR